MAKKKQVVEEAEERGSIPVPPFEAEEVAPVEVVQGPPNTLEIVEKAPAEILLTVTATEDFKDGALKERFAKYGYGVVWKAGETRSIPMNLFVRCIRSGAKIQT